MSVVAKSVLAAALLAALAACAPQPEPAPVVVEPEPVFTGKV
jgi:type IV pilus biogenesis protein CpaD/CtpE